MTRGRLDDDRLLDLLAAEATEGLSPADRAELDRLLAETTGAPDLAAAAAAVDLAFQGADPAASEPLPASLRATLIAAGQRHVGVGGAPVVDLSAARAARGEVRPVGAQGWIGWLVAAAALVLAATVGLRDRGPVAPPAPDPVAERATLLDADGSIRVAWNPPEIEGYREVEGDVVWNTKLQQGYMRLRRLPANDPVERQYQLWIVDPERDAEPVDGGVFDIPAGVDEVVIPIDPKLKVIAPAAFAITSERPGGVVVSEGPLLVVAAV